MTRETLVNAPHPKTWLSFWHPDWRRHDRWGKVALGGALLLFGGGMWFQVARAGDEARAAAHTRSPVVRFSGAFVPDKSTYHPGDLVTFRFRRENAEGVPLVAVSVDSWVNLGTGVTYPGEITGRPIDTGTVEGSTVRQVPWNISPGRYVLEGILAPQTEIRSQMLAWRSDPFEITRKKEGD